MNVRAWLGSPLMKRTWLFGLVLSAHAVAALVLFQGCRTVGPLTSSPSSPGSAVPPVAPSGRAPGHPLPPPVAVTPPSGRPATPGLHPTGTVWQEPTTSYVVQKGDSISAIAYRYSISQHDIIALNKLADPGTIQVGMTLKLPGKIDLGKGRSLPASTGSARPAPAGGSSYTVKGGDTLSGIAAKYGIKTAELKRANNLSSDMIRVDQKLVIPKGSATTPTPPTPDERAVAPVGMPSIDLDDPPPPVTPPAVTPPDTPSATTPPAAAVIGNYQTHIVKEGETLTEIAIQWTASPSGLRELNGLTSDELTPGQKLKIPLD